MEKPRITVIVGPTAVGKTAVAVKLAENFGGEIVNADSMQVYRMMDIGTAKPTADELSRVPHHLIDIVGPDKDYTAADFRRDAAKKINEIVGSGNAAFVVGGTGLYVRVLTEGLVEGPEADMDLREGLLREARLKGRESVYEMLKKVDPEGAAAIHPNNLKRVIRAIEVHELTQRPISELHREHGFAERPYNALKIGLIKERAKLYEDINSRVDRMIEVGFVEEVRGLLERGYSSDLKPMRGLGYKEISGYIEGDCSLDEAIMLLKRNTRHYAKRQITWFRKDKEIIWFHPEDTRKMASVVERHLC